MVVTQSFVAATISSFLVPIISRPLSRNRSSKIRVLLTDAKKTVTSALETLASVRQMLDRETHDTLFNNCQQIDVRIDSLLNVNNENTNILTETRRYREMVEQARNTHDMCLQLASRVQQVTLGELIEDNKKPANMMAKAEEAAMIAYLERKIKLHETTRNYQELLESQADSGSQLSFTLTVSGDTTGKAEHASAPMPRGDI